MTSFLARTGFIGIVASLALGAAPTLGADFKFPVESAPEYVSNPVELGSGWYLRGDLAWANNKGPLLAPESPDVRKGTWAVDLGAGYKFNNWLRSDATIGWNKERDQTRVGAAVVCPYRLDLVPSPINSQVVVGYRWNTSETCNPTNTSRLNKLDLMWNAYLDMGTWGGFTPFVGAGAGVSVLRTSTTLKYLKTSDGTEYAADLTPAAGDNYPKDWVYADGQKVTTWTDANGLVKTGTPDHVKFAKNIWTRQAIRTSYNLAWSLMGGVAYDITPQLKGELSYRYLNSGSFKSLSSPLVGSVRSSIDSHQLRLGFRYMMD